jgi:hypothetical protein
MSGWLAEGPMVGLRALAGSYAVQLLLAVAADDAPWSHPNKHTEDWKASCTGERSSDTTGF